MRRRADEDILTAMGGCLTVSSQVGVWPYQDILCPTTSSLQDPRSDEK